MLLKLTNSFVKLVHSSCSRQFSGTLPVITVPVYLEKPLKKLKKKKDAKRLEEIRRKSRQGNQNFPIITCKRREFNFYYGQVYAKYDQVLLASQGWKHRKSRGDYFTIHKFGENPSLLNTNLSSDGEIEEPGEKLGFQDLNLHPLLLKGLSELGFQTPTVIQELAIPHIRSHRNVLCCAETGSGKSVAYLAPIIHQLLVKKQLYHQDPVVNSPRAVIIAPSRELVEQIGNVACRLVVNCNLNVKVLVGGHGTKQKLRKPENILDLDLLITSPGVLQNLVQAKICKVGLIDHVVIDEADTMLDDSFNESLQRFLRKIPFQEGNPKNSESGNYTGAQLVLVGATLPQNVVDVFDRIIDVNSLVNVSTNQLHRILPHVPQKFLRMSTPQKAGMLLELVKADFNKRRPVMIFSNKSPTCDWVSLFLNENGVPTVNLHGEVLAKTRDMHFRKFQDGEVNVLSCTDLGSRGLDTINVQHIINFDFPHHMSDYIHRVGRTGRVGAQVEGHVTNFVCTPAAIEIVQKIEHAVRKVRSLPSVDGNIKRRLAQFSTQKDLETLGKEVPGYI
ncbi:probable ATP-dependent RNA helicase DDX28 isoform X2 [Limulus polyphemus]|uniref:RNA helicase n=1 Tax=Limulus polyphemus TaxID=6850 RepID=A0ABM1BDW8_LIMPO|nr:probable ATP-dependent RNA helicase DDX28 isoform X2 [Limulus polyphemus]XP_013780021.1 probable ATP-dependent RNA helicase DDX28 isoform X2 [Limulus polyphemus]XP_022247849.1 probable ATP-dependent RNA helicase DDX28 isoform X2 [Limulus polyphemus]